MSHSSSIEQLVHDSLAEANAPQEEEEGVEKGREVAEEANTICSQTVKHRWQKLAKEGVSQAVHESNGWVIPKSPYARFGHTAVVMDSTMVVFGGRNSESVFFDVWTYDLNADRWSLPDHPRQRFPDGRAGHTAVRVPDHDAMIIFGGCCSANAVVSDAWICKLTPPEPNRSTVAVAWQRLAPKGIGPDGRKGHTANLVDDHTMLIFGGCDAEHAFNDAWVLHFDVDALEDATWTNLQPTGATPQPRRYHVAELTKDGQKLVVFGGSGDAPFTYYNDVHQLDLATHTWVSVEVLGTPPSARMCSTSFLRHNAFCVLFGGAKGYSNDAFELDLRTMRWKQVHGTGTSTVAARTRPTVIVHRNNLMLFGGAGGPQTFLDDLQKLELEPPSLFTLAQQWLLKAAVDDALPQLPDNVRRCLHIRRVDETNVP